MAATVSGAWSKPGAWALDSEQHEDELKQSETTTTREMSDFPDLMTAAATKTKKKKGQTLSLGEFVSGSSNNNNSYYSTNQSYSAVKPVIQQGLTAEDMLMLPTGPRQRTAEELERTRLGGGFRSYGDRNESSNSRWGSGRGNGGDDEGRRSSREPLGPSRADEIDDWGAAKKSSGGGGFERRERGSGGGGGFFEGSHSRADDSDSWASNKSFRPSEGRKYGGFERERRMGFESSGDADSLDNWGKKKETESRRFGSGGSGSGSAFDSLRERRFGNDSSEADSWGRKREELGGGGGGPGSRPKLNLQPRKLPEGEVETVKAGKGSSPFGDARPREEVLKQKGEDWKEIDEKLDAMKLKELGSGDRFKKGNGKAGSIEDASEKSWRKDQTDVNVQSPSVENNENGHTEEAVAEAEAEKDAQK
ncbi:eukaryotic translation initiation factor 4B3-like [Bidens hawaiensis]|uniref:eukaryotic translation initiation factor 4B3-like n=1 Tax=Bidens hawaiensis TaxID=980011 RepID=UPI00404B675B